MKWLFSLLILSLLTSPLYAKWQKLKPLNKYDPIRDFNFRDDILYMEVRAYDARYKGGVLVPRDTKYFVSFKAYRQPLSSFPPATQKQFKELKPIDYHNSTLYLSGEVEGLNCHMLYNIYLINKKFRIYRMDEPHDIYPVIDGIDTDGEMQLMLWLHGPNSSYSRYTRYKKTGNGFIATKVSGDYDDDKHSCVDSTYEVKLDQNAKPLSDKLLGKKSNRDPDSCLHEVWGGMCEE